MSMLSQSFSVSTLPLFDLHQIRQKERGKKPVRHYRDWMLNVVKTLRLVKDVDFITVLTPSNGPCPCKIYWVTTSIAKKLKEFIQDPVKFYPSVVYAKERCAEAFRTGVYQCSSCKQVRFISEFHVDSSKPYPALYYSCKQCYNQAKAEWRTKKSHSLEFSLGRCYENIRARSRYKGFDCDVNTQYLMETWDKQNGLCFYTGMPMECYKEARGNYQRKEGLPRTNPNAVSVDRVDPLQGYIKLNVVLCRWSVNLMKGDLSIQEFLENARAICQYQGLTLLPPPQ